MKKAALFGFHVLIAMVCSSAIGALIVPLAGYVTRAPSAFLSSPFSPLVWGVAFGAGALLSRAAPGGYARWVWIIGLLWFSVLVWRDLQWYDPRWCNGCTAHQFVWYNYFTSKDCMQECIGEFLGTVPMLNSIAYSVGAAFGLKYATVASTIRDS